MECNINRFYEVRGAMLLVAVLMRIPGCFFLCERQKVKTAYRRSVQTKSRAHFLRIS